MKSVAGKWNRKSNDFYTSTIAPVDRKRDRRMRLVDVAMLTVLFLEMGVIIRLFLAK
jgi:hypothetical protein